MPGITLIEGSDINEVYKKLILGILKGQQIATRGLSTVEITSCIIHMPVVGSNVITLPGCATNIEYAKAELEWYLSGSNKIADLGKFSKIWERFSDDGVHVNSAYGHILFGYHPAVAMNQFMWVRQKIEDDVNSRQLVLNINLPSHKKSETKDFPCTIALQFMVRNNKLDMYVFMRSNDAYFGFRNDLYCFTEIQKKFASELDLAPGAYTHFATSMHLYDKQAEMFRELAKSW